MSQIDCEVIDAADAAIVSLNMQQSPVWLATFTAVRSYKPVYDLSELTTLRVTVVPKDEDVSVLDRLQNESKISFDVGIQKKVVGDAAADVMMRLRRQVRTLLEKGLPPIGTIPTGLSWVGTVGSPIFSPEHMKKGLFTSVLTFSYLTKMRRK